MDIFPPGQLPGVGMGNIVSVVGLGGLIGVAVTTGLLMAEGALGAVVWALGIAAVLAVKSPAFGDAPELMIPLLGVAFLLGLVASLRGRTRSASPQTTGADGSTADQRGRTLALLGVLVAGAATGVAWSEWNEVPFTLADMEAYAALAVGACAAAIGGHASHLFVGGSIRAGGNALIVGVATCVAALLLAAAAFYIPFVGYPIAILVLLAGIRLGRRAQAKYKGLRILA